MKSKLFKVALCLLITHITGNSYAQTPPVRAHHEMVYDENRKQIIMVGGSTPVNGGSSGIFYNDAWCFDGEQWKLLGEMGDKRSGIRLVFDTKDQQVYSFGGFSDKGSLSDLRLFDKNEWKVIANLDSNKAAEPGFIYDIARDKFVVFGGSSERGKVNSITWEWDGARWKKFQGTGPAGRTAFAMIYDSDKKKTLLYGGVGGDGNLFNDGVWEFDGLQWRNVPVKGPNPGNRISPGYAYDDKRKMMILFGGISDGKLKNDTWGWDGKEWKLLSESGPSPRVMGYIAYDRNRDKIVLFGGRLGWPNDANDTWEWDGTEWKEIKPAK